MNVPVDKGASAGQSFTSHIDYIQRQGRIDPPMSGWVDIIRKNGNKSNHEIKSPDKKHAEGTLSFTTQLLKLAYEMDHHSSKFTRA